MEIQEFDPLRRTDAFDTEILAAAKKREIKNILKSYVGTYDPFSELIQNSLDAIDKRKEIEDFEGKLHIKIDLQKNTFSITDNGIGFNQKEFEAFLAPNISFKDTDGKSRGNKGVGATYIAYGFNYLQLGTKGNDFYFLGELKDGRKWVEDRDGVVTRPVVKQSELLHSKFEEIERGATFSIKFGGEYTRPKELKWFSANAAAQWMFILLLKTPLGCLFTDEKPNSKFDLTVVDANGKEDVLEDQKAEYLFPHLKIVASADLKNILKAQQDLIKKGQDAGKLPSKYSRLNGVYEFFSTEECKNLPTQRITEDQKKLMDEFKVEAYGFFGFSTSIWDEFNDKLAKLRQGYRVIKGGLIIANNSMLQGDYLVIPLTSNIGYQNQTHVVVHFINADPDLGRKGFQPELKDLAENISVGIVNRLKKWKKQLKKDTGTKTNLTPQIELHTWIKEQEKYEEDNPLTLTNPNFFKPVNEISISSIPQTEQDVIVLFNQLIAGGVIRGIKLLATSQYKMYDGVFKYFVTEPSDNHLFDKETNPLGVDEIGIAINSTSPPYILEYKYNLDALFQEFENEEKFERNVNLAIAWELGETWKRNYEVTSLLDLENLHHRDFHGLTHLIHSNTNTIHAIILGELIDYLHDVDGSQQFHQDTYGDNLF